MLLPFRFALRADPAKRKPNRDDQCRPCIATAGAGDKNSACCDECGEDTQDDARCEENREGCVCYSKGGKDCACGEESSKDSEIGEGRVMT
jgi:hypothetical protein